MSRALAASACGFLFLAAGCAGWPELGAEGEGRRVVSVQAEGWAPLSPGDGPLTARHRALAEAQKKAVEKAVGVTLRASTRVDDAVNIRQSIEANMGGVIRRYEVLSEGAKDGFFKVRIRADVLYRPPSVASGVKVLRFSVRLSSPKIAAALRDALASSDFQLVEEEGRADVLVTGIVESYGLADPRLGGMYSYRAKVTLKVADVRSGKVSEGSYEASAIDLDDGMAQDIALEKAGRDAGLALVSFYAPPSAISAAMLP